MFLAQICKAWDFESSFEWLNLSVTMLFFILLNLAGQKDTQNRTGKTVFLDKFAPNFSLIFGKSASLQFFTKKKSFNPKNLLREHMLESVKVSESVSTFILSQKMSLLGLICSRSIWEHDFGYFVRFQG